MDYSTTNHRISYVVGLQVVLIRVLMNSW